MPRALPDLLDRIELTFDAGKTTTDVGNRLVLRRTTEGGAHTMGEF